MFPWKCSWNSPAAGNSFLPPLTPRGGTRGQNGSQQGAGQQARKGKTNAARPRDGVHGGRFPSHRAGHGFLFRAAETARPALRFGERIRWGSGTSKIKGKGAGFASARAARWRARQAAEKEGWNGTRRTVPVEFCASAPLAGSRAGWNLPVSESDWCWSGLNRLIKWDAVPQCREHTDERCRFPQRNAGPMRGLLWRSASTEPVR